mmetsp:Transcript_59427/g.141609  ORF Transcript_59427/g.141609 Transcript_59427/m.141609 type:complete len:312 (-) Transcript_59427:31-966(-)
MLFWTSLLLAASLSTCQELDKTISLKAWGSVKDAIKTVTEQAMEVEAVRSDIGILQSDLKMQESLWHQGEQQLEAENADLEKRVRELQEEVRKGASVLQTVRELQASVQDETLRKGAVEQQRQHDKAQQDLELNFLQDRRRNLTAYLTKLNDSAKTEVDKHHKQQMQLETDAVALKVKSAQLESLVRDNFKRLRVQSDTETVKVEDLQHQLASMREALAKLQQQLNQGPTEATLTDASQSLKQETAKVAQLQSDKATALGTCKIQTENLKKAVAAEQQKLSKQQATTTSFCSRTELQNEALQKLVTACEGR